ncbi:hypothetical protein, partial [Burkholderia anthinoferrum]
HSYCPALSLDLEFYCTQDVLDHRLSNLSPGFGMPRSKDRFMMMDQSETVQERHGWSLRERRDSTLSARLAPDDH